MQDGGYVAVNIKFNYGKVDKSLDTFNPFVIFLVNSLSSSPGHNYHLTLKFNNSDQLSGIKLTEDGQNSQSSLTLIEVNNLESKKDKDHRTRCEESTKQVKFREQEICLLLELAGG